MASATQQIHWDVPPTFVLLMYASMGLALLVFAYGVWRRLRIWRLGRRAVVWNRSGARLRRMLAAIGHACPFCVTTLASGARTLATKERPLRTRDFVELVADALDD